MTLLCTVSVSYTPRTLVILTGTDSGGSGVYKTDSVQARHAKLAAIVPWVLLYMVSKFVENDIYRIWVMSPLPKKFPLQGQKDQGACLKTVGCLLWARRDRTQFLSLPLWPFSSFCSQPTNGGWLQKGEKTMKAGLNAPHHLPQDGGVIGVPLSLPHDLLAPCAVNLPAQLAAEGAGRRV